MMSGIVQSIEQRLHALRLVLAAVLTLALTPLLGGSGYAQAPVFDSGSNGSDGALNLTTPGTIIFDPRSFNPPLDPENDNVYHFTTINIAAGVTVRLRGLELNMQPVYWLASGAVQIDGTIDLSGAAGHPTNSSIPADRYVSVPGAGGYPGGVGQRGASQPQPGSGPGGGGAALGGGTNGGGGAGYGAVGGGGGNGGPAYGNDFLVSLIGGSGGGGGLTLAQFNAAGGGGAGSGALLIASSASVSVNGSIIANGGNGGNGSISSAQGNGGGGSGGAIHILAPAISGTGTLQALGGNGGTPVNCDGPFGGPNVCAGGGGGAYGRIRLDAFQHTFAGNVSPTPVRATPFSVFLPSGQPSVRVVSIAGASVPTVPTGSFTTPDVTINSAAAVTLNVEAHNIPLGTVIKLRVYSENSADQIVDSTPLAGTFTQSTATASVTVPSGFSRMYVRATWTP